MQAAANQTVSVPRLIAGFQAEHPLVTISARHLGGSERLAEHVRDGDVDLGIVSLPEDFPGLDLIELDRQPVRLACAEHHRLAGRRRVSLAELADEPFVDGPPGWGNRAVADRAFAAAGLRRTLRFEVNDTQSIVQFVAEGLAVALLPPSMAATVPSVRLVQLDGATPVFRTLLAAPAGRRLRVAVQEFAAFVQANAAAD
jgi:DNA-binding transcriptional LysR family regulator